MKGNIYFNLWGYVFTLLFLAGCSAESASEGSSDMGYPAGSFNIDAGMNGEGDMAMTPGAGGRAASGVTVPKTGASGTEIADLPVEQSYNVSFELPQAGKNFVFVTNSASNTVAVIDAANLGIQTVETGANPRFLQTVAGTDTAIALNVDSSTATVIRASLDKPPSHVDLEVIPGANAIAIAPDGKHAVVYVNSRFTPSGKSSGSYQKITVITLSDTGDTKTDMTVAYKPSDVFFSSDSAKGYVVAEQYVSVLDFAEIDKQGAGMRSDVSLGYAFGQIPKGVSVTPNGRYALARLENASVLHLVDLTAKDPAKAVKELDLAQLASLMESSDEDAGAGFVSSAIVTDLDLSSDGSFAVAVVREKSTVLRIPIPQAFEDPLVYDADKSVIDTIKLTGTAIIGSATLAPDNRHLLLYTTAIATGAIAPYLNHVTILDLQKGATSQITVPLYRSVKAVAITSDSANALIEHQPQANAASAVEGQTFEGPYAYSMLKLSSGATTMQTTWAAVGSFALVPEGKSIFMLFRDDKRGIKQAHRVSLDTFVAEIIGLESPPNSVGSIPNAYKVFIGQEHAEGWITFIDLATNQKQSVTGFELNGKIRE